MQISCQDKQLPQLGASYIERGETVHLFMGGGVEMGSHYVPRPVSDSVFLSQPPACCDHRQAPPCPAFNLILINLSKFPGTLLFVLYGVTGMYDMATKKPC